MIFVERKYFCLIEIFDDKIQVIFSDEIEICFDSVLVEFEKILDVFKIYVSI